jgi:SMC interacting uncharacterized protein involved in chromosome segregation
MESEENELSVPVGSNIKISIHSDSFKDMIDEDGDLISHYQEILNKLLADIILQTELKSVTKEKIAENIQKAVKITNNIISTAERFVEDATLAKETTFIGFVEDLEEEAKANAIKTLTIAIKLRENNLLLLIPLIKNLTNRVELIETVISKTSLEQMKDALEDGKTAIVNIQ